MRTNEKTKNCKNKIYIGIFLFLVFILFLTPLAGDDWGNYLEGIQGFPHIVSRTIEMYFLWEGRIVSRFLIYFMTYHKWLWNILNAVAIVGILYYMNKIAKFKNKEMMILSTFLVILFMNIFTFSQVITWIAGSITYLWVIPLIFLYYDIMYHHKDTNSKINILLCFLHIIIPMFVEHMAILFILCHFYFIYRNYHQNKTLRKKDLFFLVISIISFMTMYFSPGNQLRSGIENVEFNRLSIYQKMIYNIPNFFFYTYQIHYFLIFLWILGNIFLIKKYIKNGIVKKIAFLLEGILGLFSIQYLLENFGISLFSSNGIIHNLTNWYYFGFTIFHICLLIQYTIKTKNELPIFFFSMGMISNFIMLLSPVWGYRTSFATYLFLSFCYLMIIDENLSVKRWKKGVLVVSTVIGMIFYVVFYISIAKVHQENQKMIQNAKKQNLSKIQLISYPSFAPCNINPTEDYHIERFKDYYRIPKNVHIEIIHKKWKYSIFYP